MPTSLTQSARIIESARIIRRWQSPSGAYLAGPRPEPYQNCWFRDGSWIALAMDLINEHRSAEKFHDWAALVLLRHRQEANRAISNVQHGRPVGKYFLHARYTPDGKKVGVPWGEFQLDGLGVWLWSLSQHLKIAGNFKPQWKEAARLVCDYLDALWKRPCYNLWEETPGKIHTSTLASIYGGLESFSQILPEKNLSETCGELKNFVLSNAVYNGRLVKSVGSREIDSSLLLCPIFNLFPPESQLIKKTAEQIIEFLGSPGPRRYRSDKFYGGGKWLPVAGFLGWYFLSVNLPKPARETLTWLESQADENGNLPEQVEPRLAGEYEKWNQRWGPPAKPLLWSHALHIILKSKLEKYI